MSRPKQPIDELEDMRRHAATDIDHALQRYALAILTDGRDGKAQAELYRLLAQTMIFADLMGRRRVLLQTRGEFRKFGAEAHFCAGHDDKPVRLVQFADVPTDPLMPRVSFEQAIEDILSREPTIAVGYRAVQDLYARRHAFAVAKSVEMNVTKRVQKEVAEAMSSGRGLAEAREVVSSIGNWTRAYADNVYMTNLATAYSAGQVAQAQDPDISQVMLAYEFMAIEDAAVRPNHLAADGLIAATNDPVWQRFMPPVGYSCRCAASLVSRFELEDRGLLKDGRVVRYEPPSFASAHPDPGFERRALVPSR